MTWFIHIQQNEGDGIHCRLPTTKPILIGRADECNVRIMGPKVSRKHCKLEFVDGQWTATDLGSRNGTRVNGKKVRDASVGEGDEIRIGNAFLSIFNPAEEESKSIIIAIPTDSASMSLIDEGIDFALPPDPEVEDDSDSDILPRAVPVAKPIAKPAESKPVAKAVPTAKPVAAPPAAQDAVPVAQPVAPNSETPSTPSSGDSLEDRYELGAPFHSGATGLFYRALHRKMDRYVCVKILAQQYTENEEDLKRLLRGVKTASVLHHPNIVQIHDAGQSDDGNWWLAMEYVDGPSARSLAADVDSGKLLSPDRVVSIARDIATAMQVANERNIIHRNITPDNILLTMDGIAKLSNFTLARGIVLEALHQITTAGETIGEVAYLAPEATQPDQTLDCRTDIYGLGACLYALLTGKPPFTGSDKAEVLDQIRFRIPTDPSKYKSIPRPLEALILKCLKKRPDDRFTNPQALLDKIDRIDKLPPG